MTDKLLTRFKQDVEAMTLIPAGGGVFELEVDGKLIYSKKKTGEFPNEEWVLDTLSKMPVRATA